MTTVLGSLYVDKRLWRVNKRQTRSSDVVSKKETATLFRRRTSQRVFNTENKQASFPRRHKRAFGLVMALICDL